ncbi:MAG: hypothetical protein ACTS3R_13375 [Inquilinaceae bacterium]
MASLSVVALGLAALPAAAEPITLAGITFSDELGGFELLSGTGSGTRADPFVLVERVDDDAAAVLVVRGLTPSFGNRVGTGHLVGFALTKIVTNGTGTAWPSFSIELQQVLGVDSTYGDGLSFGQGPQPPQPPTSTPYEALSRVDEPLDGLTFGRGRVEPGESAEFRVVVTETTPTTEFYIVQRRDVPLADGSRSATTIAEHRSQPLPPPW